MPAAFEDRRPPSILWHYTTQYALAGIIGSGELWASHIRFLNDSRELGHSLALFESALNRRSDAGLINPTMVRTIISSIRAAHEPDAKSETFVSSFSEAKDDLSQWRAYSPGEIGYALGFDPTRFPIEQSQEWPMRLASCVYDSAKQDTAFETVCDKVISGLDATIRVVDVEAVQATSRAYRNFMRFAPYFKDVAFENEREWRLVSQSYAIGSGTLRGVRLGKLFLVPHLRLPLATLLDFGFDEIIVGPCPYPDLAMSGLRSLLTSRGISRDVRIRKSEVPFRSV